MGPVSAKGAWMMSSRRQRYNGEMAYIIEKYGCFLTRGSFILSAGLRWSNCKTPASQYTFRSELIHVRTYAADQTLSVLVHRPILRELQLILEHPVVHVRMVFCPEWRL